MNLKEKRAFIRNLTNSVRDALLARADAMPEEWDGHELRQFLADEFAREVYHETMKGRRLREYRNARADNRPPMKIELIGDAAKSQDAGARMNLTTIRAQIRQLSRERLEDLIDEAEGVGCLDECDMDRLREDVLQLYLRGKIPYGELSP